MRKILVYGDINLNSRDGSAIWLLSIVQCLARTNSDVYLLLKADLEEPERLDEVVREGVTILTPFDDEKSSVDGMRPRNAAQRIASLDHRFEFDIIISRGFDIASYLAISGRFTGRMWPYLTEGPAFRFDKTQRDKDLLTRIGDESRRVFAQTEDARSVLEANMPTATGKTLLMNPIIPDDAFALGAKALDTEPTSGSLSLVYPGKFARFWNTLEMSSLPRLLADRNIDAQLHMIGDKFNLTNRDYDWLEQMRAVADSPQPGVTWHGGMPRQAVLELVANFDVGLSWRDAELDSSPEVSTKMLEYAALGTPPVLNRSAMHEELLGPDYPLFIDGNDVLTPLVKAATDPSSMAQARHTARSMAEKFSMASTVERYTKYFERAEGQTCQNNQADTTDRPLRVLLAGHDFKFAADLLEMLRQKPDIELRVDHWDKLAVHDEQASSNYAQWADTVICEWAGPNAVYYSKHLSADQKLLVRFHGFEIRGQWLNDINIDNVDQVIFVSDFYRRKVLDQTAWPEEKTSVIYNTVDEVDLSRPKISGAEFQIGLAGYVPMLKRPDRAIDLLRRLIEKDNRYFLRLRGREPWNYPWEWDKPVQQDAYRAFFYSIANDPLVRDHVIFEEFGPDMGSWFRKVGWILSPSTRETFHLAPVEGMISGSVPVVWQREGAEEIFGSDFVHPDTNACARFILENSDSQRYKELQSRSIVQAAKYELSTAREHWFKLITSNYSPAPAKT